MPPWRTFAKNDQYLCAADLWDEKAQDYRAFIVQVERVTGGEVTGEGGRKRSMPFAHFAGAKKSLGLNSTNARTISTLVGSENTDRWKGQWIELFVTKTKIGGDVVDCIRIKPSAPKPPERKPNQSPADAPLEPPK